ncbi:MAG: TonB-dependent receptor, partial [Kangiellaceae bacterium]|nr:TonB-dependent receptor [Kangiellaceae bacterium]
MKRKTFKVKPLSFALRATLFSAASLVAFNAPLVSAAEEGEEANDDNKIVVTGSRIKRVDVDGPSPVITISREDMNAQGYGTVADVIDGLSQNAGGTIDQSFTFGFTPAASSVNLRGLGFGRSLVLIDGRRMPIYPTGISGTTNFVNLSSIPTAMIDRIDILTGSASAIYGSDAVAGVINVITRKDIEDASLEVRMSDTSEGGAEGTRVNFLGGLTAQNTHVDFIVDYFEQKPLWARDRDYAASDVADPRGAYSIGGSTFYTNGDFEAIQDPNCGTPNDALGGLGQPDNAVGIITGNEVWCGFDRSAFRQLIAPQKNLSLTARLEHEFDNDLLFNARFGMTKNSVNPELEPNFYGGGLFTGTGTLVPNNGGLVPAGASNNPTTGTGNERAGFFVRRLVEYGPRSSDIDDTSRNALLSLSGTFGDDMFEWEVGYMTTQSEITNRRPNIILSALNLAVENGLDLFQPIPQDVIDATRFDSIRYSESTLSGFDFSITGELDYEMSGGNLGLAIHGELIEETYDDNPDPLTIAGQGFDGASAGGGTREHTGLGIELYMPILESFSVSAAVRYDDYDDDSSTGSATSPQLSFEYRPTDDILVRATWGESFRAPDMQRLFGATTRAFQTVTDPFNGG